MTNNDIVKILILDCTDAPTIRTEKYEFPNTEKEKIKETILSSLNRIGKSAHAIIKYKNEYFDAVHTAQGKIESLTYHKNKIKYHPYMKYLT